MFKYLNNNIFRFRTIGGINIITHANLYENKNSSMLSTDWL